MNVKIDENLPISLRVSLGRMGHDVDTVQDEGLRGRVDEVIWDAAQREGRFLVTQDLDFSDIRKFQPGTHFGILLVRLREPGRTALRRRIEAIFTDHDVEDWSRCFVVATDRKVRVRRP